MSAVVQRWREVREDGIGKPEGAPWRGDRGYFGFLRRMISCVLFGHVETKMIHRYERVGSRGRVMQRDACGRCGRPLAEQRSKLTQFPQPRGSEFQNWRQQ